MAEDGLLKELRAFLLFPFAIPARQLQGVGFKFMIHFSIQTIALEHSTFIFSWILCIRICGDSEEEELS